MEISHFAEVVEIFNWISHVFPTAIVLQHMLMLACSVPLIGIYHRKKKRIKWVITIAVLTLKDVHFVYSKCRLNIKSKS